MHKAPIHKAGITALAVAKADAKALQDFLASRLKLSRRSAKAVIDGRNVWVNRKCVWIARYALNIGDSVEIASSVIRAAQAQNAKPTSSSSPQQKRHIRVLWQNENYLVCDKPAGILSCDDPKSAESILREQEHIPTLEAVHRLDRDTSGCLLFAKRHAALEAAIEVFKSHKVEKTYHAIVAGDMKLAHLKIDAPLDGQNAITYATREASGDDASFVRLRIDTGRTNQIRRHLASVRLPVLGDRVFGLKSARDARLMAVPRQMLHASTLVLPDPLENNSQIRAHSPLPADFRATLVNFGLGRKRR